MAPPGKAVCSATSGTVKPIPVSRPMRIRSGVSTPGGKGIRKVETEADLDSAIATASREAEAAFGDGRLLIEKFVTRPRHVEVQVAGDTLRVRRELEGGWFQWVSMPMPALLTIQSGINQLRYATLKGIMAAKKKEIRVVPAPSGLTPLVEIRALAVPAKQKQTRLIPGGPAEAARELVRALREDVRVLEGA